MNDSSVIPAGIGHLMPFDSPPFAADFLLDCLPLFFGPFDTFEDDEADDGSAARGDSDANELAAACDAPEAGVDALGALERLDIVRRRVR